MNKYELRRMIKDKSGQEDEDTERQNNNTQDSDYDIFRIRDAVRKKTELCGKNSQVAPPPQFGKSLLSKKSWVYFSF